VSRLHCKIVGSTDKRTGAPKFVVCDNKSLNGLAVNWTRTREHELQHGDLLSLGGCGKIAVGAKIDSTAKTDVSYRFLWLEPASRLAPDAVGDAAAANAANATNATTVADTSADMTTAAAVFVKSAVAASASLKRPMSAEAAAAAPSKKRAADKTEPKTKARAADKTEPKTKATDEPRFKVGDQIEAQSLSTITREVDAWFDAKIVSVNKRMRTYRVNFTSYGSEFDEHLDWRRCRARSNGDWSLEDIVEGQTRMLVQWRERELWYDAIVTRKLADPADAAVGLEQMCLQCKWIDTPYGMSPADAKTEFQTNMMYAFFPEQHW
jgi:hypothetical protein